mgnify:CR=1 FL=1
MTYAVRRTDPGEWEIIDDLYPVLRRFAAVAAPADMEPDDLLQAALVHVLRRHALKRPGPPGRLPETDDGQPGRQPLPAHGSPAAGPAAGGRLG